MAVLQVSLGNGMQNSWTTFETTPKMSRYAAGQKWSRQRMVISEALGKGRVGFSVNNREVINTIKEGLVWLGVCYRLNMKVMFPSDGNAER